MQIQRADAAFTNKNNQPTDPRVWLQHMEARMTLHAAFVDAWKLERNVQHVLGDGDCLWHAIAASLNHPDVSGEILRAGVVTFMRCNPEWKTPGLFTVVVV